MLQTILDGATVVLLLAVLLTLLKLLSAMLEIQEIMQYWEKSWPKKSNKERGFLAGFPPRLTDRQYDKREAKELAMFMKEEKRRKQE